MGDIAELTKRTIEVIRDIQVRMDQPDDAGDRVIVYRGVTETVARDGGILRYEGGQFEAFLGTPEKRGNPVVKWNHGDEVIGRVVKHEANEADRAHDFWVEFMSPEVSQFADEKFRQAKAGFLPACSAGFAVLEFEELTSDQRKSLGLPRHGWVGRVWEMRELSIVPVGADPDALQRSVEAGEMSEGDVREMIEAMGRKKSKTRRMADKTITTPNEKQVGRGMADEPENGDEEEPERMGDPEEEEPRMGADEEEDERMGEDDEESDPAGLIPALNALRGHVVAMTASLNSLRSSVDASRGASEEMTHEVASLRGALARGMGFAEEDEGEEDPRMTEDDEDDEEMALASSPREGEDDTASDEEDDQDPEETGRAAAKSRAKTPSARRSGDDEDVLKALDALRTRLAEKGERDHVRRDSGAH
jgi:hypothetical protein